jgi:hypothetical protein
MTRRWTEAEAGMGVQTQRRAKAVAGVVSGSLRRGERKELEYQGLRGNAPTLKGGVREIVIGHADGCR